MFENRALQEGFFCASLGIVHACITRASVLVLQRLAGNPCWYLSVVEELKSVNISLEPQHHPAVDWPHPLHVRSCLLCLQGLPGGLLWRSRPTLGGGGRWAEFAAGNGYTPPQRGAGAFKSRRECSGAVCGSGGTSVSSFSGQPLDKS